MKLDPNDWDDVVDGVYAHLVGMYGKTVPLDGQTYREIAEDVADWIEVQGWK